MTDLELACAPHTGPTHRGNRLVSSKLDVTCIVKRNASKIRAIICIGAAIAQVLTRAIRFAMTEDGSESGVKYQHSVKNGSVYVSPWGDGNVPSLRDTWKFPFYYLFSDKSSVPSNEEELNRTLPVHQLSSEVSRPPEKGVRLTWLGHASVLTQFENFSILADPIFSDRCSPLTIAGPKRYRPPPCTVAELPNIDAVCISHTHYDHLDVQTVQDLNKRFGSNLCWFVPIGLKSWMIDAGCENIVELDWWESNVLQKELPNGEKAVMEFVFTPSKHWCNRGLFDRNTVLWGSWVVLGSKYRYYFAGDTGYCDGFRQIGQRYGPFDVAAIPIGAYEPREVMKKQHVNPEESVKIHQDVRAKKSLGIHWGTFVLTLEHYLEPPKKLKEALEEKGISEEDFFTVDHGESKLIIPEDDTVKAEIVFETNI